MISLVLGPSEHADFTERSRIEQVIEMLARGAAPGAMKSRDFVSASHLVADALSFFAIRLAHASLSHVVSVTPRVRSSNFNTRIDV